MGKTFETQIKAIGEQSQKQIKAIQIQGHVKTIKKFTCDNEDTPFVSKQKEIFHKLVGEKVEKITDLDYTNARAILLILDIVNKIQEGKTELADVKK